jgi:hypothetical protein
LVLYLTKKMVKSVIYLLFSYQTGYIMWHSLYHSETIGIELILILIILLVFMGGMASQWLATGHRFSPGTQVSSTNKTDCHDITEVLLKHFQYYVSSHWNVRSSQILNVKFNDRLSLVLTHI